ncbi:hypothetical protein ACFL35_05065 [Candidatus Riflebacteria bacterium]
MSKLPVNKRPSQVAEENRIKRIKSEVKEATKEGKSAVNISCGKIGIYWWALIDRKRTVIPFTTIPAWDHAKPGRNTIIKEDSVRNNMLHTLKWKAVKEKYPALGERHGDKYWEVPRGRIEFYRQRPESPYGYFVVLMPGLFEDDAEFMQKIAEAFDFSSKSSIILSPDPEYSDEVFRE